MSGEATGPQRIVWEESRFGYSSVANPHGLVDGVHLFSLSWRGGNKNPTPYAINTTLPGITVKPVASPDEGRARCERVLDRWLARMSNATAPAPVTATTGEAP